MGLVEDTLRFFSLARKMHSLPLRGVLYALADSPGPRSAASNPIQRQ